MYLKVVFVVVVVVVIEFHLIYWWLSGRGGRGGVFPITCALESNDLLSEASLSTLKISSL